MTTATSATLAQELAMTFRDQQKLGLTEGLSLRWISAQHGPMTTCAPSLPNSPVGGQ
jgi:hypothetical protein